MKNQEIISRLKSLYESIYQPTIRDNPRLSLQIALALLIIEYKQLKNEEIILTLSSSEALVVSSGFNPDCTPLSEFDTCLYISCVRRKYTVKSVIDRKLLDDIVVNFDVFATFYSAFSNFYPYDTTILSTDSLSISETLEKLTTADDKLRQHKDFLHFSGDSMEEHQNKQVDLNYKMSCYASYTKSSKLDDKGQICDETMGKNPKSEILPARRISCYVTYTKQALKTSDKQTIFLQ